jgi:hypothetical protein
MSLAAYASIQRIDKPEDEIDQRIHEGVMAFHAELEKLV